MALNWRKSSYSGGQVNACVEVALGARAHVRDTKAREAGELAFSGEAFTAFLSALKRSR
ncbi:DUF397 domain-containing protein [Amycolatopsis sp. NPDC059027]|uniref:DUF397 domain-containing protein n=1 Tax=Amycolatopsis sp. NPDC059027 TaxID=3346709 RepID=UPI003672AC59